MRAEEDDDDDDDATLTTTEALFVVVIIIIIIILIVTSFLPLSVVSVCGVLLRVGALGAIGVGVKKRGKEKERKYTRIKRKFG